MAINLDRCVSHNEDGETWDLVCPITDGSCGEKDDDGNVTPFHSREWPTKAVARARLDEHIDDHRGVAPMSTLEEFRRKHKLTVNSDGRAVVSLKDL